jgi:uncharacterized oxidoreductase
MPRFSLDALHSLSRGVIEALGTRPEDAEIVAAHLVSAHLAGHDSHGVIRLVQYRDHARSGKVVPAARVETLRESETTALLDGHFAWGQVIARRAVELAIDKAAKHQVAAVSVRNAYHVGRVGVYPLLAAERGYLAQVHCNGHGVVRVAPWGGTEPRLATNPIAIAVPTRSRPILVDITTSVVAEGKVRVARNAGKRLPEGWVLDRHGRPSTDPADLYSGGSLLPLGGREGHKGYGLSVIVDLLGGALSGAGCGTLTERIGNGLFIQVTDPEAFTDREELYDRIDELVAYLKSSPCREGVAEILLPGEPEERLAAERARSGIEVDDVTWAQVAVLACELGVRAPVPGS